VTSWGPIFFQVQQALFYHLSVQFTDIDFQEISGKHPENSGNLLSQAGFFPRKFTFSDWFFPRKFTFSDRFLFPGNFPV
jgi:hypothetical protein